VGYTDARVPWPLGRQRGRGARGPILYGALARAVRKESNLAICYWWGVTGQTVRKWRRALGVETHTEGTMRLHREHFKEPWARIAQRKAWAKARDPQRCAKIAAAKIDKTRPKHVIEAMRKANLGRKLSHEQRQKMSEAHRQRWKRPPL